MSLNQRITVACDHGGCLAYRQTRSIDETAPAHRLKGISDGWTYREGDDYCPEHRPRQRRG